MYNLLHYFFLPPRRALASSWRWDSLTCPPFPHWRAALCCRECRAVLWGIWRAEQSWCHQCSQTLVFSAVGPKYKNKERDPLKHPGFFFGIENRSIQIYKNKKKKFPEMTEGILYKAPAATELVYLPLAGLCLSSPWGQSDPSLGTQAVSGLAQKTTSECAGSCLPPQNLPVA